MAGSIEGSERAAIRERELKLRTACEDGDFERYKELAIETWPTIVGGVPKETRHCADLLNVPDVPMMLVHDNGEKGKLVRRTLLHSACIGGDIDIVKHLVSVATAAGNREFVSVADSIGQTTFHVACGNGMPPARVLWARHAFAQPTFCMAARHFSRLVNLAVSS